MTPLGWTVLQFVACALAILLAGVRLARYGDIIAEKTGLGGTWLGVLALASVTSLPELITGASSVTYFDLPDIAAGDVIGSCMFNLVILAMLDVRDPRPLSARLHHGHVLSAAFGIVLLGLALLAMAATTRAPIVGWIGLHSVLFIGVYVFAMRTIFVFERSRIAQVTEELAGDVRYGAYTLRQAIGLYAAAAAVLVAAAAALPGVAGRLATLTALGESFVGSIMVATATSLPEVVVSMAAARLGAIDMAVGNLFGSNLFNIAVLGVDDLLYTRGSLLMAVDAAHMATLTAAMVMTAIAIIGLTYRAAHKRFRLSWDSFAIVAVYLLGAALLQRLA